jgi:hypothetical protein
LAGLDAVAWAHLLAQVVPLFEKRHEVRAWQAAFDKLNEAKGYNYLARIGCTHVHFVPVSSVSGQQTPDLEGRQGNQRVLCEVKTINPSDAEASSRHKVAHGQIVSGFTQDVLPTGFFDKLMATVKAAEKQMRSYCSDRSTRRIVYIILNFDDRLHQYGDDYVRQIRNFIVSCDLPEVKIVFDVKPRFYSATSQSPHSQLFSVLDSSWTAI